ncbi:hypothetical protein TCAP_00742 [Tolypocladium capitatum]|uniref:Uncharacterized protein n=1 Tax=Tolypocladium capitatum TaxID=45235 RepID=A0A2K3QP86_9HYPO|nr:hypothetical protein TCAP_00742 [Tolypocladium capitatum]
MRALMASRRSPCISNGSKPLALPPSRIQSVRTRVRSSIIDLKSAICSSVFRRPLRRSSPPSLAHLVSMSLACLPSRSSCRMKGVKYRISSLHHRPYTSRRRPSSRFREVSASSGWLFRPAKAGESLAGTRAWTSRRVLVYSFKLRTTSSVVVARSPSSKSNASAIASPRTERKCRRTSLAPELVTRLYAQSALSTPSLSVLSSAFSSTFLTPLRSRRRSVPCVFLAVSTWRFTSSSGASSSKLLISSRPSTHTFVANTSLSPLLAPSSRPLWPLRILPTMSPQQSNSLSLAALPKSIFRSLATKSAIPVVLEATIARPQRPPTLPSKSWTRSLSPRICTIVSAVPNSSRYELPTCVRRRLDFSSIWTWRDL